MERFVTCLSCIDGRVQLPVIDWIKQNMNVQYIDIITKPGMVKWLSGYRKINEEILTQLHISMHKHNSKYIYVIAHHDCAGNLVSDEEQKEQILVAVDNIRKMFPSVTVKGLWVNEQWQVSMINKDLIYF